MDHFRTLIANDTILSRTRELARDLREAFPDEPPCMVSVVEGARVFVRHLMPNLGWPVEVHEIRASSYGGGTTSSGEVKVSGPSLPVADRHVLLIEDIVDTGHTIAKLRDVFYAQGATRVDVITLLSKPSRREVDVSLEFVGFEIPNEFVIGFGMDFDGKYRELDRVAVYEEVGEATA